MYHMQPISQQQLQTQCQPPQLTEMVVHTRIYSSHHQDKLNMATIHKEDLSLIADKLKTCQRDLRLLKAFIINNLRHRRDRIIVCLITNSSNYRTKKRIIIPISRHTRAAKHLLIKPGRPTTMRHKPQADLTLDLLQHSINHQLTQIYWQNTKQKSNIMK